MVEKPSWTDLIAVKDLETGWVTPANLGDRAFAVFDAPDRIYVTGGFCPHEGGAICDGYYDNHRIECPRHQRLFDIRTGRSMSSPAGQDIEAFESRIRDGVVQIFV